MITIPMSSVSHNMTATIALTGLKRFNLRCRIGIALMRFAAWVLPFRTEVEVKS